MNGSRRKEEEQLNGEASICSLAWSSRALIEDRPCGCLPGLGDLPAARQPEAIGEMNQGVREHNGEHGTRCFVYSVFLSLHHYETDLATKANRSRNRQYCIQAGWRGEGVRNSPIQSLRFPPKKNYNNLGVVSYICDGKHLHASI